MDMEPSSIEFESDAVLDTQRTILRAMREADIPVLHERVFGVPNVMKWVFSGKTFERADSEMFIRKNFGTTPSAIGLSVLADKANGDVLGFAGLNRCNALSDDDLEIGFVLAREAWGRGLATEIGRAQIDFGFKRLGRTRLLALAAGQNDSSIRALAKLGMRYHSDISPVDRAQRRVFYICRDEWPAAHTE